MEIKRNIRKVKQKKKTTTKREKRKKEIQTHIIQIKYIIMIEANR